MSNPIRIPARDPDDWRALLADPRRHWRVGYSAYELAYSWHAVDGLPPAVAAALAGAPFGALTPEIALVEHKVAVPGAGGSSATDLFVLGRSSTGKLVTLAVEGKVDESFDREVRDWLDDPKGDPENRKTRLAGLCRILGVTGEVPDDVPYQLFHRAAAAVLEAERFGATDAVLLIHSFSRNENHRTEYERFARLLGATGRSGAIETVGASDGVCLHLCWAADQPRVQAHDGDPEAIFRESLDWLRDSYRGHRFFKERDVEAALQGRMTELFEERRSDLRVYENHRVPGKRLDLAVVDRHAPSKVILGIELKYEPDPSRAGYDIRGDTAKFPVCLREEIDRDVDVIRDSVAADVIEVGYAVLLDEGGYWRDRREPPSGELIMWGEDTKTRRAPAIFLTRAPK